MMNPQEQNLKLIFSMVALFFCAFLVISGCSSKRLQPAGTTDLQTNADGDVVRTTPLVEGVNLSPQFYEEMYPEYTRGITIVLNLPADGILTAEQKKEIHELFKQSRATGAIHQVHVLAWAFDRENKVRSASESLERVRAAVTPHLEKTTALINSFNMEDSASWTARLLMNKQARMKSHFAHVDKNSMFRKIIIGVSTTERKSYVHPEMVSL